MVSLSVLVDVKVENRKKGLKLMLYENKVLFGDNYKKYKEGFFYDNDDDFTVLVLCLLCNNNGACDVEVLIIMVLVQLV